MSEYKPLGSEKLNGDEKLKRILELTYYNQNNKKSSTQTELVKESRSGKFYGIVKEKDGYYVKMGLNEQSLDYIGGLFMKNKNRFSSYAEALKRLELLKGQDNRLNEATKYVLKKTQPNEQDTTMPPAPDAGVPAPDASMPPADMPPAEAPTPEAPAPDATASPEETSGEAKRSDYMAEVQKFAGKLGQELRDQKEKMESDDVKYVLNMVISAVDLEKLDIEDLEEIGKKFEREEEASTGEEPAAAEPSVEKTPEEKEAVPAAEPSGEEEVPFQAAEGELYELDADPMKDLEEFINSEIDLSSYSDEMPKGDMGEEEDKVVEVDAEKLKSEVNKGIDEILGKYFKTYK